jgi:hypothetical protein
MKKEIQMGMSDLGVMNASSTSIFNCLWPLELRHGKEKATTS